ncbi:hypothetical protein [Krasilnikovia sp. M28-CT-15]|uniref:hypothetical protein n=1 Tax=Krasilnikovia sp. M28-CT-15 TaxID=3373540 RepID=UPI003875B450
MKIVERLAPLAAESGTAGGTGMAAGIAGGASAIGDRYGVRSVGGAALAEVQARAVEPVGPIRLNAVLAARPVQAAIRALNRRRTLGGRLSRIT